MTRNKYMAAILLNLICLISFAQHIQLARKTDSLVHAFLTMHPVVPGLSVAVVDGKGAMFMKGYGWADKENGIRANEHTLFYIASVTKSFTGLMAALLDHEKKVILDLPLKHYAPGIQFKNRLSDSITSRHLLTHTSGLMNAPLVHRYAFTGNIDRGEMLKVFADLTGQKDTAGHYRYDNLGYNIYSLLIKESLGLDWRDELQRKIFEPLGMNNTTGYMSVAKMKTRNIAMPYTAFGRRGMERILLEKADNSMQSAGGLVSSASDLSKWLTMQMNNGMVGNRQVFPADVIHATRTPYAKGVQGSFPFRSVGSYGLGWFINEYEGRKVIYHFGGYPGSSFLLATVLVPTR